MKMLDSFKIDKKIQKLYECSNGYIINGHYYNKNTMSPKPLEMYPTYGDNEDMALNSRVQLNHSNKYQTAKAVNSIINDKKDPTVCYNFTVGLRSNGITLLKIKEDGDNTKVINYKEYTSIPTTNGYFQNWLGQDDKFLYASFSADTSNLYFMKIDKVTLDMSSFASYSSYNKCMKTIYEDDTYIYYATQKQYAAMDLYRYDKIAGSATTVIINQNVGTYSFQPIFTDPFEETVDDKKVYSFYAMHQDAKKGFYIKKYTINPSTLDLKNIVTSTDVTVEFSNPEMDALPTITSKDYITYELFISKTETKKYLNLAIYCTGQYEYDVKLNGIYTYEINSTDNTKVDYKGKLTEFAYALKGMLSLKNNDFLVLANKTSTFLCTFNKTAEKFEIVNTINNQPYSIGVDQEDNIWVTNAKYEVEMYSPSTPTQVKVSFEKDSYSYEGEAISTNIIYEAKNYAGEYIETDLELSIKGNAVFQSNQNKTLIVKTGIGGSKSAAIDITGAGSISVYTKVIL